MHWVPCSGVALVWHLPNILVSFGFLWGINLNIIMTKVIICSKKKEKEGDHKFSNHDPMLALIAVEVTFVWVHDNQTIGIMQSGYSLTVFIESSCPDDS